MSDDWHFPRGALAEQVLAALMQGPSPGFVLFGPRRTGKTEFLTRDLARVAADLHGHRVVYVDFWQSPDDPLALMFHAIDRALADKGSAALLSALRAALPLRVKVRAAGDLLGGEIELGASPAKAGDLPPALQLDRLVERLARPRRPALLILDEFQEIARHKAGAAVIAALRATLTRHRDGVRTVFSGSSRTRLDAMFSAAEAPFFRFAAPFELPPLDESFVDHQLAVFARINPRRIDRAEALAFFARFRGNPQFFQRWLQALALSPTAGLAASAETVAAQIAGELGFPARWRGMTPIQRAMARLLAEDGDEPYGAAAGTRTAALMRQAQAPTVPQRQAAMRWLVNNGVADKAAGAWQLADPLFADWIAARGAEEF
jgi:hypothetical protein